MNYLVGGGNFPKAKERKCILKIAHSNTVSQFFISITNKTVQGKSL